MSRIGPEKLAACYVQHGPALQLYVRQWLAAAEAADVVQEVFASLITQRQAPESVQAWLFRSARNAAINNQRSRRRRHHHEASCIATQPGWFQPDPASVLDARTAEAALNELPDDQREVIVLRIWAQLGWQDIASLVDRPVSTVFSRYRSGLEILRQRLENPCRKNLDR